MANIDPSRFYLVNVADTCAVWNILSSLLLYNTARDAGCQFCITDFVNYECLTKPRTSVTAAEIELMARLRQAERRGEIEHFPCDIDALELISALESRRRLGKGELSSIAMAMTMHQAFITDDMKARKLAEEAGLALTQTTAHLFSWLVFRRRLGDADKTTVVDQHQGMGQQLAPHFEKAYELALQCLLSVRS